MSFDKFKKDAMYGLDHSEEADTFGINPEIYAVFRDLDAWNRLTDQEVKNFFIDRNINITPETLHRLLFLNKRRKEIQQDSNQVYGGETTETHLDEVLDIVNLVPEDLKIPAIIHDIGKTGPWEKDGKMDELNEVIMSLYAVVHDLDIRKSSVKDLLNHIYTNNQDKIAAALKILTENNIDPEMKLNDFYPLHVEWGHQVLNNEQGVSPKDKFIALNHHRLLRGIEITIDGYEPTPEDYDKAAQLEITDFFIASIRRSGKSLEEVKELIRKVFSGKIDPTKLNIFLEQLS